MKISDSIDYVAELQHLHGKDATFHLSIYENGIPGSGKTKYRKDYYIKNIKTNIHKILLDCKPYQEVALHSDLEIDNKKFHLPQMDFAICTELMSERIRSALSLYLKDEGISKTHIFSSGNSFHGYGDALLGHQESEYGNSNLKKDRIKYLASLLLSGESVNSPKELFDARRVGHCLCNGSSALRITKNTNAYKDISKYYKTI